MKECTWQTSWATWQKTCLCIHWGLYGYGVNSFLLFPTLPPLWDVAWQKDSQVYPGKGGTFLPWSAIEWKIPRHGTRSPSQPCQGGTFDVQMYMKACFFLHLTTGTRCFLCFFFSFSHTHTHTHMDSCLSLPNIYATLAFSIGVVNTQLL